MNQILLIIYFIFTITVMTEGVFRLLSKLINPRAHMSVEEMNLYMLMTFAGWIPILNCVLAFLYLKNLKMIKG